MRKTRVCIIVACCLIGLAALAQAQSKQKPGLWEVTSSVNFGGSSMPQMPQMPPNVQLPPGVQMPQGGPMGGPRTTQVCVTQAMIDKYGGPYSSPTRGDCQLTNISIKDNGMTANIACTGQMTATGTVESIWPEPDTTQTKMHMTGTMQMGPNSHPVDITMQAKSVYKGPDCGSVKPLPMPPAK
ncbi:MAG TPA: DUF3617 domain-containing protein [Terracidiphilus sp.]|nr:DUF3617 domain-containing protein [Terracidiphilus sp.]